MIPHHITIVVANQQVLNKSITFFEGVLGLQKTARPLFDFPGVWFAPPPDDDDEEAGLGIDLQLHVVVSEQDSTSPNLVQQNAVHGVHFSISTPNHTARETISQIRKFGFPAMHLQNGADRMFSHIYTSCPSGYVWEFTSKRIGSASDYASVGTDAIASTGNKWATATAVKILQRGGTAADAAVAANLILGVVEPMNAGMGGSLMAMVHDPRQCTKPFCPPVLFDAYSTTGSETTLEKLKHDHPEIAVNGQRAFPEKGPVPTLIPGAPRGWCDMWSSHGRLPWADLFADAIEVATSGFIITPWLEQNYGHLASFLASPALTDEAKQELKMLYAHPSGRLLRTGDRHTNLALARGYRLFAAGGCDAFYGIGHNKTLSEETSKAFRHFETYLNADDLKQRGKENSKTEPIQQDYSLSGATGYHNLTVFVPGNPSLGPVVSRIACLFWPPPPCCVCVCARPTCGASLIAIP
jgi:catechol 2,3-dioxygenase-like lactoylglutathione lyase family enzyme